MYFKQYDISICGDKSYYTCVIIKKDLSNHKKIVRSMISIAILIQNK